MFEGGYRVPCVARLPGRIPAGSICDELATTMDILPTVSHLISADLPTDRTIDGKNIWPLLSAEPDATTPHESLYCYYGGELQAVRDGRYKLHLPHTYRSLAGRPGGTDGKPVNYEHRHIGLELFDLKTDPGETTNVAADYPEVVDRLKAVANTGRADLGDKLTDTPATGARPPGRLP